MAWSKIFQAQTAHSPQHPAHKLRVDSGHLFFFKPACPWAAKQLVDFFILPPEGK